MVGSAVAIELHHPECSGRADHTGMCACGALTDGQARRRPVSGIHRATGMGAAVPRSQVDQLLDLLSDVVSKATPYGEQDGGFVATYILPTGPIHRICAALGEHGRPVPLPATASGD
jgi:hypothetical protein